MDSKKIETLRGKNVLITGGAGFIGSHLCEEIGKNKPKNLIVVDNLFLGKEDNLKEAKSIYPKLKFYKGSVTDYGQIKKYITENNVDVVFNLAVIPLPASLIRPKFAVRENIHGALNLCELARKKYFKTFIHCSTSEVYGTAQYAPMDEQHPYVPSTPYAASKAAADQLCLSYAKVFGIDLAIARPFNNYGPRQNAGRYAGIIPIVINKILDKKTITIYSDGRQSRDYIFVKDTARAIIKIYESKNTRNRIINIASGREISVNNLVRSIIDIMAIKGVKIKYAISRPGDVRRHCGDNSLARKLFDFKLGVKFEYGLKKTVSWYIAKKGEGYAVENK